MDHLHEMFIADEIGMCGSVLLLGLLVGAISRIAYSVWIRRTNRLR